MTDEELIKETMMLDYSQLVMNCVYEHKENKRLNNIINELEKWCEDYRDGTGLDEREVGIYDALGDVLKKINELRGDKQ